MINPINNPIHLARTIYSLVGDRHYADLYQSLMGNVSGLTEFEEQLMGPGQEFHAEHYIDLIFDSVAKTTD